MEVCGARRRAGGDAGWRFACVACKDAAASQMVSQMDGVGGSLGSVTDQCCDRLRVDVGWRY